MAREVANRVADEVRKAIGDITATVEKNSRAAVNVGLAVAEQASKAAGKATGNSKKSKKNRKK